MTTVEAEYRLDARLSLRLTAEELNELRAQAVARGMKTNAWARILLRTGMDLPPGDPAEQEAALADVERRLTRLEEMAGL